MKVRFGSRSTRRSGNASPGCLIGFGCLFTAFGSLFAILFVIMPVWRALDAEDWQEVPAVILASELGVSEATDSDSSDTYRVEVRYEYWVNDLTDVESDGSGTRYESTRYDFSDGMYSGGYDEKMAIVKRLAPGTQTVCFIDPHDPSQAVLVAGVPEDTWIASFVFIFPVVGIAIMIGGLISWRRQGSRLRGGLSDGATVRSDLHRAMLSAPIIEAGPAVLKPGGSRRVGCIVVAIFALIWNGAVWPMFLFGFGDGDEFDWLAMLFMSPFLLVGLGMLFGVGYMALAMTNPRWTLRLASRRLQPGQSIDVDWECEGRCDRVLRLDFILQGSESATYVRGTNTQTDTRVFYRRTLRSLGDHVDMRMGRLSLAIPADAVPSFKARNNRIEWKLLLRGDIPRWPDVKDDYDLDILPAEPER